MSKLSPPFAAPLFTHRWLVAAALFGSLASIGCAKTTAVNGQMPGVTHASCAPADITLVNHYKNEVLLDVCGEQERWTVTESNRWQYLGEARLDSDRDGVPNGFDRCPGQVGPSQADALREGCPEVEEPSALLSGNKLDLDGRIHFEPSLARITGDSDGVLDALAEALNGNPAWAKIEIQGHTDDSGPSEINRQLSQRRAQAVVEALVNRGVAADRMSARGFGASQPIASNDQSVGRRQNRRVEIAIVETL